MHPLYSIALSLYPLFLFLLSLSLSHLTLLYSLALGFGLIDDGHTRVRQILLKIKIKLVYKIKI